ncbi:MAG: ketoacyl-ACP synthase III [Chitinispirillaceae bacterium]|nr:ketoacyl-ACP synthase III [Chitinispirillaceae bacterium]
MPTTSRILGTGHYLPEKVVTNFDIEKMFETSDEFIVTRTGVRERRHAEANVSASDLAVLASRAAVDDAGLTMDQIDCIIMNTITPDHNDPGCAFFLHEKLNAGTIPAFDIREQCCGLLYGMAMADSFVRTGMYRHVLVVCSEVLSKRIDGSYDGRNISILFGDGAGAVVVGPSDDPDRGIKTTFLHAEGAKARALYTAAPGTALGKMSFLDKDDIDTGRIYFRMIGKEVFENGVARMCEGIEEILAANNIGYDDIDLIVPHQPNLRMLEAIIERSKIPLDKIILNVDKLGNIASACLPIALDQARKEGRIKPGDLILLVGFGSGFVWGSMLVRM